MPWLLSLPEIRLIWWDWPQGLPPWCTSPRSPRKRLLPASRHPETDLPVPRVGYIRSSFETLHTCICLTVCLESSSKAKIAHEPPCVYNQPSVEQSISQIRGPCDLSFNKWMNEGGGGKEERNMLDYRCKAQSINMSRLVTMSHPCCILGTPCWIFQWQG